MGRLAKSFGFSAYGISQADIDNFTKLRTAKAAEKLIASLPPKLAGDTSLLETVERIVDISKLEGPYFPLRRYGDFIVYGVKKDQTTYDTVEEAQAAVDKYNSSGTLDSRRDTIERVGTTVTIEAQAFLTRNTLEEAKALSKEMEAKGYTVNPVEKKLRVQDDAKGDLVKLAEIFMKDLTRDSSTTQAGKDARAHIELQLLKMLADNSATASAMQREGWGGVNVADMERGFSEYGVSSAWQIADAENVSESEEFWVQMRKLTKASSKTEYEVSLENPALVAAVGERSTDEWSDLLVNRANLLAELEQRELGNIKVRSAGAAGKAIGKLGFMYFLASPAYSLLNSTQVWLLGYPALQGKYGNSPLNTKKISARRAILDAYAATNKAFAKATVVDGKLGFAKMGKGGFSEENTFNAMIR